MDVEKNKDFIHEIINVETLIKNLNKLKRDWHCSKSGYFMQVLLQSPDHRATVPQLESR
jgi:hypothetical protein